MDIKGLLEWWQGKDKYDGSERRSFARLVYPPNKRPTLKIRDNELEVINISEEGLKFLNFMQREFGEKISGTVIFSNGKSIDVIGKIIWEHGNEFGMLVARIKRNIIIEEIRAYVRFYGKKVKTNRPNSCECTIFFLQYLTHVPFKTVWSSGEITKPSTHCSIAEKRSVQFLNC